LAECFGDRLLDMEIECILLEDQFSRSLLNEDIPVIAPSFHFRFENISPSARIAALASTSIPSSPLIDPALHN